MFCEDPVEQGKEAKAKSSDKCKETDKDCPLATLIVHVKNEDTGDPIKNATVEAEGRGAKPTGKDGKAVFAKIPADDYTVKARKDAHTPDPRQDSVTVPASKTTELTLKLTLLELHMHLDADRDGKVDADWTNNDKWEVGTGKHGAIVLCNNDDENKKKSTDKDNDDVDTAKDLPDIAPLVLRKSPKGKAFPKGWKAIIEVSDKDKFRLFDKRAAAGTELIGPTKGKKLELADLSKDMSGDELELGMEATQYPDKSFDGMLQLSLELQDDKGKTLHTEKAKVRVAPWILFHHRNPVDAVYVVKTSDNAAFIKDLDGEVSKAGIGEFKKAAGIYASDRWMQDAMEIGFATLPNSDADRAKWHLPTVLRTANDRSHPSLNWGPIDKYPKNVLLGPGYGFTQAVAPLIGSSLDSFGNLECSPPFTHSVTKVEYKYGRIVYGMSGTRPMAKKVREFLHAQKVQDPFDIDTEWLVVGHVDEVMSFCPMKGAAHGFKVLLANPVLAIDILRDVKTKHGNMKLFEGIRGTIDATVYTRRTTDAILGDAAFVKDQKDVQKKIKKIKDTFKVELGLKDTEFIDLPVLFRKQGKRYVAYTPGVVNMLVLTKTDGTVRLCIPKPFGPMVGKKCQFEKDVEAKLGTAAKTGVNLEFIDDFTTYHELYGEIHCGTNTRREPATDRWWWEQEGI